MSGVAGFTHSRTVPEPNRIRNVLGALMHRGPDRRGVYESPSVSLGAVGDQPVESAESGAALVLDGSVYNHAELRCELERRGHHFHSPAPAETVLAAFREWDTGCFTRLRGMFALAVWSEPERRLVLARDRLGVKPLYLARRRGDLYFGSEIKALFAHAEIERRISLAGLDCYLSLNCAPCPWTLAEGVEKLPPAHWLEWREGAVRSEAYWHLPDGPPSDSYWTPDGARNELDCLLKQAMRDHLQAETAPGIWIGAGIESAAILHYAASAASAPLKTYSFGTSEAVARLAAEYGTDHYSVSAAESLDLAGTLQESAYYFDEPCGDAAVLALWFLARVTRQTSTAALAGVGADEIFGGCPGCWADRLAQGVRPLPAALPRWGARLCGRWPRLRRFLEGCLLAPAEAHAYWNGAWGAEEKRALAGSLPGAFERKLAESGGSHLAALQHFDQKYALPDRTLAAADRMSMAHSVEVRPPFLDYRIVEFAATLPDSLKIRGARRKIMLQELMRGKLPALSRRAQSKGEVPLDRWLRGPLRPLLVETVESAADYADLFHPPFLRQALARYLAGRGVSAEPLWGLMILFLWMKRWRIQTIPLREAGLQATPSIFTSV